MKSKSVAAILLAAIIFFHFSGPINFYSVLQPAVFRENALQDIAVSIKQAGIENSIFFTGKQGDIEDFGLHEVLEKMGAVGNFGHISIFGGGNLCQYRRIATLI